MYAVAHSRCSCAGVGQSCGSAGMVDPQSGGSASGPGFQNCVPASEQGCWSCGVAEVAGLLSCGPGVVAGQLISDFAALAQKRHLQTVWTPTLHARAFSQSSCCLSDTVNYGIPALIMILNTTFEDAQCFTPWKQFGTWEWHIVGWRNSDGVGIWQIEDVGSHSGHLRQAVAAL